jgi:hypothetical protein
VVRIAAFKAAYVGSIPTAPVENRNLYIVYL